LAFISFVDIIVCSALLINFSELLNRQRILCNLVANADALHKPHYIVGELDAWYMDISLGICPWLEVSFLVQGKSCTIVGDIINFNYKVNMVAGTWSPVCEATDFILNAGILIFQRSRAVQNSCVHDL
jgi:hypothetical protein